MDGIRATIGVQAEEDGSVTLSIDWADVVDGHPGQPLATEKVRFAPGSKGRYVARAAFGSGEFLPGSIVIDADGKRHFHLTADPATVDALAETVTLTHES